MEYLVDLKLILNSTHKEGEYVLKRKAPWILFLTNFVQKIWGKTLEGTLVYTHTHTYAHKIKGFARVNGRGSLFPWIYSSWTSKSICNKSNNHMIWT
jgi:hypothetical protein